MPTWTRSKAKRMAKLEDENVTAAMKESLSDAKPGDREQVTDDRKPSVEVDSPAEAGLNEDPALDIAEENSATHETLEESTVVKKTQTIVLKLYDGTSVRLPDANSTQIGSFKAANTNNATGDIDETASLESESGESNVAVSENAVLETEEIPNNTQGATSVSNTTSSKKTVTINKEVQKTATAIRTTSRGSRGNRKLQAGKGGIETLEHFNAFLETSADNEQAEIPKRRAKAKKWDGSGNNSVYNKIASTQAKKKRKSRKKHPTFGATTIETKPQKDKAHYTNKYQVKLGYSRYTSQGLGPTKEEVCKVFDILHEHHAKDNLKFERDNAPIDGSAAGPMHSSSEVTVDAFVQTILSQTTTNIGALQAYWLLRRHYPYDVDGRKVMGKKPNYHDMRTSNSNKLINILRPAGLQNKKAYVIQNILKAIYEMNVKRETTSTTTDQTLAVTSMMELLRPPSFNPAEGENEEVIDKGDANAVEGSVEEPYVPSPMSTLSDPMSIDVPEGFNLDGPNELESPATPASSTDDNSASTPATIESPRASIETELTVPDASGEIVRGDVVELPLDKSPDFVPGLLSISHLQELGDQSLFDELVSHEGVGVKTAFCIMAFNLARPVFAVDTHVYRMCKFLGWSPKGLDENKTAELLDFIVPKDIKYALHQVFWHHGQKCVRCRANSSEKSIGWDKGCPIEEFVDRTRYVPVETKAQKEKKAEKEVQQVKAQKAASMQGTRKTAAKTNGKAMKKKSAASQATITSAYKIVKKPAMPQVNPEDSNTDSAIMTDHSPPQEEGTRQEKAKSTRKRKGEPQDNGRKLVRAEDGTIRMAKKMKVEETSTDEDVKDEYAEIEIHDDFDAGRNQNVTRTLRFKVPNIDS